MPLLRWRIAALLVAGATLAAPRFAAAEVREVSKPWKIPPLVGELEGEFRPLTVPDAPILQWKIATRAVVGGVRAAEVAIDGPGTRMRAVLQLDAAGNGSW